ncbi:hypothetical protein E2C01_038976 [Portunus trituberculatus]|uniref:Uncharacterized protein n=1 Tax=Portunus trituberculatus TaxID=210409 RepID=A0A5B7FDJ7_PORTR|nr:hypothetical protein [Portunus trituberculatus]
MQATKGNMGATKSEGKQVVGRGWHPHFIVVTKQGSSSSRPNTLSPQPFLRLFSPHTALRSLAVVGREAGGMC